MTARALVLGGGGVTGVAWEIGLLAGLTAQGTDLTSADLVIGTSAGAIAGAQVTSGASLGSLFERQLSGVEEPVTGRMGARAKARFAWAMLGSRDAARTRVRIGRMALAVPAVPEARRRAVIQSRLPSQEWPSRLLITAVDASTGKPVTWDMASGIPLVDAVAASCAVPGVWPPVTIAGRRWIDGGIRSPANADLAASCQRIVVLAPVTMGSAQMPAPATQVAALRAAGKAACLVQPDQAARRAIGRDLLDPARRAPAARAGYAQAAGEAAAVAAAWG